VNGEKFVALVYADSIKPFLEAGIVIGVTHPENPKDGTWLEIEMIQPRRTLRIECDFNISEIEVRA
jgi:hypothetical protein